MGHAVGLEHELDAYAVMDHGTKAWTRGPNGTPQMELLPDDINGVLALYGGGAKGLAALDVSVTNTWFFTAEERTQYNAASDNAAHDFAHKGCSKFETSVADLTDQRDQQLQIIPGLHGPGLAAAQDRLQTIEASLSQAVSDLYDCRYGEDEAAQLQNCMVSSRGDTYADPGKEAVLCGVNSPGSQREAVSTTVCPGDPLQLHYTLNNRSRQSVRLQQQVWLSKLDEHGVDDGLEVSGSAADIQSPEIRTLNSLAGSQSMLDGWYFKIPANTPVGEYAVYVRIIPLDPTTGNSLWNSDVDQWNNSIRVRGTITTGCPHHTSS